MRFVIEVDHPQQIELFHDSWLARISEEVRLVLNTPLGSVPCYREFGMDMSYLHFPMNSAMSLYASAAAEAIERNVPELRVNRIYYDEDKGDFDRMSPTIEVTSYEQT